MSAGKMILNVTHSQRQEPWSSTRGGEVRGMSAGGAGDSVSMVVVVRSEMPIGEASIRGEISQGWSERTTENHNTPSRQSLRNTT